MPKYVAALTLLLLVGMVLTRAFLMQRQGIAAMKFGSIDKTDFIIPPFALFFFYIVFAAAFGWPTPSRQSFFASESVAWIGVGLCGLGLVLFAWSIVSFGRSFRVGIDTASPDRLVTTGLFAFSRNPIYVAFGIILLGEFLIVPNWIVLLYLIAGVGLFHRQVVREEAYLESHYGAPYDEYCRRVRRYF